MSIGFGLCCCDQSPPVYPDDPNEWDFVIGVGITFFCGAPTSVGHRFTSIGEVFTVDLANYVQEIIGATTDTVTFTLISGTIVTQSGVPRFTEGTVRIQSSQDTIDISVGGSDPLNSIDTVGAKHIMGLRDMDVVVKTSLLPPNGPIHPSSTTDRTVGRSAGPMPASLQYTIPSFVLFRGTGSQFVHHFISDSVTATGTFFDDGNGGKFSGAVSIPFKVYEQDELSQTFPGTLILSAGTLDAVVETRVLNCTSDQGFVNLFDNGSTQPVSLYDGGNSFFYPIGTNFWQFWSAGTSTFDFQFTRERDGQPSIGVFPNTEDPAAIHSFGQIAGGSIEFNNVSQIVWAGSRFTSGQNTPAGSIASV